MYSLAARIQGAAIIEVPLRREAGYGLDLPALLAALTPDVRLVYLCTPNNPTGNLLDRTTVLNCARALAGRGLLVGGEAHLRLFGAPALGTGLSAHRGHVAPRTLCQ